MIRNRKICAVIAVLLSASMLAAGCDKGGKETGTTDVSINVIGGDSDKNSADSGGADSADVTTAPPVPGAVITDANGDPVTGFDGNVLTEPDIAEPGQTLSPEELQSIVMGDGTTASVQLSINSTASSNYGYDSLNAKEKELYDAIVDGFENIRYKICPEDAYTIEEWAKVYGLVYMQEPRLFYIHSKLKVGRLYYLTASPDVINEMQKSIDAVADKVLAEAKGKSSTFDKLKVFHDYLVLNSTFEMSDDRSNYNASIYNAFGSGEPQGNIQCAGYAKAMKYLCDKAGIPCMVITGENEKGSSHAWNVVDVDGKWYNIDCTWDDPILKTPNPKNLRYNFFLVPDAPIHNISHFKVNQKKLTSGTYITYFTPPACTSDDQNYFKKSGLVYSDFDSADKALKAAIEKAAKEKTRTAQIMLSSKELYKQVYDARMDYNNYSKTFSGVKGVSDECVESLLLIEFDVLYN